MAFLVILSPCPLFLWEPPGREERAFSSQRHGVCSSTDISVLRKGGIIWQKCHFACCVQGSHLTKYLSSVHTNLCKNSRQPCAVSELAGHQTSAELWVLVELWLEFPEFEVVELIVLPRVLLETCVVGAACLHQPKPGAVGTAE